MEVNKKRTKYEKEVIITTCSLSRSVLPTGLGRHDVKGTSERFKEQFLKLLFRCEHVLSSELWSR